MDETLSPALEAKGKKSTRGERVTAVIQSKILRQTDRVDPLTNLGKSKGFGFLEMRTHKDALKVLRWSNNNPEVGPLMREWAAAELDDLEKKTKEKLDKAREEAAADLENMELNYKKLQAKVKDGVSGFVDQMKQGKTLLIEFSVENVQVSCVSSSRRSRVVILTNPPVHTGCQATSREGRRGSTRRSCGRCT